MKPFPRRVFIKNLCGLSLAPVVTNSTATLLTTPRQSAGPFYPDQMPLDDDNNLTEVSGFQRKALGDITDLTGRVQDNNGSAIADARIEIWQCDFNSRYRHSADRGQKPIDAGFQGFGKTQTNANGQYRFRTIRPVAYPGRTPHIHVAVFIKQQPPLITQLYNEIESQNNQDFLYQTVPPELRRLVTTTFNPVQEPTVRYRTNWDIIIGINGL